MLGKYQENWDIRQGEKIPTFIRLAFQLMEDGETRTRVEIQELILPEMEDPIAESTVGGVLKGLASKGLIDLQPGRYMKPHLYTLCPEGWTWWNEHKDEDWGYGEYWSAQVKEAENSKIARALDSGKSLRMDWPIKMAINRDLRILGKERQLEVVIRVKRDG